MIAPLLLLLAAPAAVDAPPPPPPPLSRSLATIEGEADWVPFTLTPAGQIRFAMEMDGRAVSAILDTGVSHSVLARGSAAYDPARARPGGSAVAVGGAVGIDWMRTRRIALAGTVRDGGEIAVADLPARATGGGDIDLLVGRDLLERHAIDIDYPARRFRLVASGRLPFVGQVAPLAVSAHRRLYESAVTIGGRRIAPMIVDTGDGAQLTMTEAGWRASGVAVPTTSALSYGVAGAETTGLAVAPDAALGEAGAGAVEVRIEPPGGLSQRIGVVGRIGSGLLQSYRVLLDPGAGRMVLSRASHDMAAAPARSTSGLLMGVDRDRLRVLHVMRGGPAAAAGWRAGEEVCQVDGAAIGPGYAASPLADWAAGTPGRTVSLRLCDGDRRRLTLQRFY